MREMCELIFGKMIALRNTVGRCQAYVYALYLMAGLRLDCNDAITTSASTSDELAIYELTPLTPRLFYCLPEAHTNTESSFDVGRG